MLHLSLLKDAKSKHTSSETNEQAHGNQLKDKLKLIEENESYDGFDEIHGNTCCRIIYDPVKAFPNIGLTLPSPVFVKLYNYPEMAREYFPRRQSYYDMFINEFEINEMLAQSQFASNYARLIMSGYWNRLPSHPMHIFEYLGEEKPIDEWSAEVYYSIKSRLEEIHLMGISHNDIRSDNIHVSVTGNITLIDFGLAIYPCNDENNKCDIEALDRLFSDYFNDSPYDKSQVDVENYNANTEQNNSDNCIEWNDDAISTHEAVFDELITGSDDTPETTKLDFNQKTDNDMRR